METQINNSNGNGNWIAFLFGVIFNVFANFDLQYAINHALYALLGGLVCLAFKILADAFTPFVKLGLRRIAHSIKRWRRE